MPPVKHMRRARRLAMQALCGLDADRPGAMDLAIDFIRESEDPLDVRVDAQQMLAAAWEHRADADALLAEQSRHWDLRRMAMVDRNILRLAVWELSANHAPPKVVISESVALAKEFSTAESPRFVNGILDAIARRLGAALDEKT